MASVTDPEQIEAVTKEINDQFGSIDILVNNAGVIRDNLLFKMTDVDWDTVNGCPSKRIFSCCEGSTKVYGCQ